MSFADLAGGQQQKRLRLSDTPYARVTLGDKDAEVVKAAFDVHGSSPPPFYKQIGNAYRLTISSNGLVTSNIKNDDKDIVELAAQLIAAKYYKGRAFKCSVDFKYATPRARRAGRSQDWHSDGSKDVGTVIFYGDNNDHDELVPLTRFRKHPGAYELSEWGSPFYTAMLFDNTQCEHAGPKCDKSKKGFLMRIGLIPETGVQSGFGDVRSDDDWKPWTY